MIAIYTRKSVSTEKGDSIQNQISICKNYIMLNNPLVSVTNFKIYEDEGYSGKNIDRPMFKTMMQDIKQGLIDTVVCYRLDRISRKVSDFSKWIEFLQEYKVKFVSIKESFDTTTSIGRAMVNISSIFAELERETISERVKDNLRYLAKKGQWLCGYPPWGFKTEKYFYIDSDRKKRKCTFLVNDYESDGYIYVKRIFDFYRQTNCINHVVRLCKQYNITSPNNTIPTSAYIRGTILHHTYACADIDAYKYLKSKNCIIGSDKSLFNGQYGLIIYKQHINPKERYRSYNMENWIISVGKHKPIISGKEWVEIMEKYYKNKNHHQPFVKTDLSIFNGILYCSCGCKMIVRRYYTRPKEDKSFKYICESKTSNSNNKCGICYKNGNIIENKIMSKLDELLNNVNYVNNFINMNIRNNNHNETETLKKISKIENKIQSLQNKMSDIIINFATEQNCNITVDIENPIEKISKQIQSYQIKIYELKNSLTNVNYIYEKIENYKKQILNYKYLFNNLTQYEKMELMQLLIQSITIQDENTFHIVLNIENIIDIK